MFDHRSGDEHIHWPSRVLLLGLNVQSYKSVNTQFYTEVPFNFLHTLSCDVFLLQSQPIMQQKNNPSESRSEPPPGHFVILQQILMYYHTIADFICTV